MNRTAFSLFLHSSHTAFSPLLASSQPEVAAERVRAARQLLTAFVADSVKDYMVATEERFTREARSVSSANLVQAQDKVFCKLHAVDSMVPNAVLAKYVGLVKWVFSAGCCMNSKGFFFTTFFQPISSWYRRTLHCLFVGLVCVLVGEGVRCACVWCEGEV